MITLRGRGQGAARGLRPPWRPRASNCPTVLRSSTWHMRAGYRDWNTLAARLTAAPSPPAPGDPGSAADGVEFARAIPILRIFDEAKAREFYVDYLGFRARLGAIVFEPDLPLYLQVSRSGLLLHLSEHHGDGTPGSVIFCEMTGIRAFHAELTAKAYRYYRPGLEQAPWGLELSVEDGFGNGLRFCERSET